MPSKAARLDAWLRERAPVEVSLADFDELLTLLRPVAESDLRRLLRATGAALHPLVAGVDQDDFHTLRATLLRLADWYERGNAETRRVTRRIVITAKDHAKLAARNARVAAERREQKEEMAAWMLTWLENPAVFAVWVQLRARALRLD